MWLNLCICFCVQMGSYFGYAVATTDINSDGWVVVLFLPCLLLSHSLCLTSQCVRAYMIFFLAAGWLICWWELPCSWFENLTAVWKKWAGFMFTYSAAPWTWSSVHLIWQETRCMGDMGAPLRLWEIWTRTASTVRSRIIILRISCGKATCLLVETICCTSVKVWAFFIINLQNLWYMTEVQLWRLSPPVLHILTYFLEENTHKKTLLLLLILGRCSHQLSIWRRGSAGTGLHL